MRPRVLLEHQRGRSFRLADVVVVEQARVDRRAVKVPVMISGELHEVSECNWMRD